MFLDGPCLRHCSSLDDTPFIPRAIATLPAVLTVQAVSDAPEQKGVFAKSLVSTLTVFGSLYAPTVAVSGSSDLSSNFLLTGANGSLHSFILDSDDLCNWMKYVRLAGNRREQNVMAYQQDDKVYFTSMRTIHEGEELRVWYSRKYAGSIGKPALSDSSTLGSKEF